MRKIQVIDNGEGIAEEDVVNAFKRHATSKIHNRDDLFRIRTLGFRGGRPRQAWYPSVSHVTLETAVAGQTQGTFLKLIGGKVEVQEAAFTSRTKLTVENLFFNFLRPLEVKTLQTELANIGDIVNRLALSHLQIAFVWFMSSSPARRVMATWSRPLPGFWVATAKKMLPLRLKIWTSRFPAMFHCRKSPERAATLSTIINGRYIKNFALNKAIVQGYGSKLMIGRFPIAVIEITMDPLLVDVNVHPTNQEVRLSKEKELTALLAEAIKEALRGKPDSQCSR